MGKTAKRSRLMSRTRYNIILHLIKLTDIVMLFLPVFLSLDKYYKNLIMPSIAEYVIFSLVYLFALLVTLKIYDALYISTQRISELCYSQFLSVFITDFIAFWIISLWYRGLPSLIPLLLAFGAQLIVAVLWSLFAHRLYYKVFEIKPTAIIYDSRHEMDSLINEYGLDKKYNIQKIIKASDCLEDISVLDNVSTVFLSGIHSHPRNIILKYCMSHEIEAFVVPTIGDVIMSGAKRRHMFHLPMLQVYSYMASPEFLFVKRLFDIILSLIALIITSPIMLVISIAIKITDKGPVFYIQTRLTKGNKEFRIIKFRSMKVDAEIDGVARLSTGEKDKRITSIGKIIRKCRLDELPQLINILVGDMSIVGPRPERPEIAKRYCKTIPEFNLRLQAKAGLTGYAQVYGKYNTTPYNKLQMDLMYIANPCIREDLKIILATVKILFIPDSTEGVSEVHTDQPEKTNNEIKNKYDFYISK